MSNENRTPAGVPTGGQFAASAKDEAAIDIASDRLFATLVSDSVNHLDHRFPGGRAFAHGDEALTFEDASGNSYTVRFRMLARGEAVNVSPDDSYGYPTTAHRMTDLDGILDSDDVVDAVGRTLEGAHKRRAFRAWMDDKVTKFTERYPGRIPTWATNDDYAYTFGRSDCDDYVRFGHFDYAPGMTHPDRLGKGLDTLRLSLGSHADADQEGTDADKQVFEVRRADDRVHYFDDNGRRLAPWQVSALEAEIAERGAPSPAAALNYAHHSGAQRLAEDKGTAT